MNECINEEKRNESNELIEWMKEKIDGQMKEGIND